KNCFVTSAEIGAVILWNIEVFITLYLSYAPPEDLPLAGKSSGTAFFTVITVVGGGTIAFTKAAIMLRLKPYNEEGVLKHAGVCMQIGSLIGAVVCALTANLCKPPDYLTSYMALSECMLPALTEPLVPPSFSMTVLSSPSHHRRRRNSSLASVPGDITGPAPTPADAGPAPDEPGESKGKTLAEEAAEPTAKNTFRLRMPAKGQASPMALLLFVLIGVSAWIETNALFSELWAVAP
ncbi:hypothetical protein FOZ61_003501, partial [Perkinsus olseni]